VAGAAHPATADDGRVAAARDLDHPATFTPAFATKAEWMARAQTLRRQVRVALGLWPWPARTPLDAVVRGKIVRDGYTIEQVAFESVPGHWVTGNLYRPTGRTGRLPAVLAPHGHWPGRHQGSRSTRRKAVASGGEQHGDRATRCSAAGDAGADGRSRSRGTWSATPTAPL
jgi:hypothetical protein